MEKFSPKVTIELDEYNRLKDIEFQVGVIKNKLEIKLEHEMFADPLAHYDRSRSFTKARISEKDLAYFFNNLFDIDVLHVNMGDGIEFAVKNREGEIR